MHGSPKLHYAYRLRALHDMRTSPLRKLSAGMAGAVTLDAELLDGPGIRVVSRAVSDWNFGLHLRFLDHVCIRKQLVGRRASRTGTRV